MDLAHNASDEEAFLTNMWAEIKDRHESGKNIMVRTPHPTAPLSVYLQVEWRGHPER
jgi:hypothetical protein